MRKLTYDVAVSLDGFICRPDGNIGDFVPDGPHVDDYRARLEAYDTVVMGRRTYEFGYAFGLVPGKRAYPHMDHYVISSTLRFEHEHELKIVRDDAAAVVRALKEGEGSDIYLCGGSRLAGALLDARLIDRLVVKLNPFVMGEGRPLFSSAASARLAGTFTKRYENGVVLAGYDVVYGG